jgi:hypothetical protein
VRRTESSVEIGCGLTTWRSAANAPDEYLNSMIMLGAFVCCNGVLGAMGRDSLA